MEIYMIPLSVCIIGKNEEDNIEKCLLPLVPHGFEIIYVDTGSTDHTKQLASKYASHVYDFTWIDDFSAARNFSLEKCSHDQVLIVDCDEYLTEINLEGIDSAIRKHPKGVGMLLRNNYFEANGTKTNYPDRVERLFSKRQYHYTGIIHEQVTNLQTESNVYERYDIPLTVDHVGYSKGMDSMIRKAKRNNDLLLKEIEKNPEEPYFYFQIGQSYNSIFDYDNSYLYYKKAFDLPWHPAEPWVPIMVTAFINSMNHTGRSEVALTCFLPLYNRFADDANFLCSMGNIYLNLTPPQPLKAMSEYIKALQCPTAREEGANTFIPYYNIGLVNEMLGNMPSAISFYEKAASLGFRPAIDKLTALRV